AGLPQCITLIPKLPGLAAVIDRVARRQDFFRLGFELRQSGVDTGTNSGDLDRIQLLEPVQAARLHGFLQRRDRAERNQLPLRSTNVVIEQLVRIETVPALDLRDHAVAPAL